MFGAQFLVLARRFEKGGQRFSNRLKPLGRRRFGQLFGIRFTQHRQRTTPNARRRLNHIRHQMALARGIKVGQAGRAILVELDPRREAKVRLVFTMRTQVVVSTIGDALNLLCANGGVIVHQIVSAFGVVSQFFGRHIVDTDALATNANASPPSEPRLKPALVPRLIGTGHDEKLDFHLLKFAYTEEEIARVNLVAKRLTNLRDAEGQLAAGRRQHIVEISENALGRFGAQIGERTTIAHRPDLGFEHHVKGAGLGQISRTAVRTLPLHMVSAPTTFTTAAVHQRVVERLFVTGVLPDEAVHQNRGVKPLHIIAFVDVGAPPIVDEVLLQLNPKRPKVVGPLKATIDFGAGEDEATALTQRDDLIEGNRRHRSNSSKRLGLVRTWPNERGGATVTRGGERGIL